MKTILIVAAFIGALPTLVFSIDSAVVCPDQAELFAIRNPDEAQRYSKLDPISVTYMDRASKKQFHVTRMLIGMVRERADDPEELRRYLDMIEKKIEFDRKQEAEFYEDLANRLQADDRLYFFSYNEGVYWDFGILVLREGEVVYQKVQGSGVLGDSGDPIPNRDEREIDNL